MERIVVNKDSDESDVLNTENARRASSAKTGFEKDVASIV